MKRRLMALGALALIVAGCDNDRGARQDLPNSAQTIDEGEVANVVRMPDKFPGMVWQCFGRADTTGYYTVTDRYVWIVYNDPNCGGEGPITVVDNVPGGNAESE